MKQSGGMLRPADELGDTTRVVVTGAAGLLGRELVRTFGAAGAAVVPLSHADIDLGRPESLSIIGDSRADIVVNAAAWTDVDGCAQDPKRARQINATGAGLVAEQAARSDAFMVQVSTNEVFDGTSARAYDEEHQPNPINPYGWSKLEGERAVAAAAPRHLVVRTAWIFGPERGFPARIRAAAVRAVESGQPLSVVEDEWGNPTPAAALAQTIVEAARRARTSTLPPILHLAGEPAVTRLDWAHEVLGDLPVQLRPIRQADYARPSTPPSRAILAMDRARTLGLPAIDWRTAMAEVAR